jgi:glycosyltransferase involved in cell wall biosynthesis
VQLNLYGTGPCEQTLRQMTATLGLDNVHFRGHVADLAEIWRTNHLLVMPSRQEGVPMTVIEAMSCGRPAVLTDVGRCAELCADGETGFIASAAAVGPLAEALERAWARRAEWPDMGRRARVRMERMVPRDPVGDFCELLGKVAVRGKPAV